MPALISLLISLIVLGLILWVIWWIISMIPVPPPFQVAIKVVFALICLVALLWLALWWLDRFPLSATVCCPDEKSPNSDLKPLTESEMDVILEWMCDTIRNNEREKLNEQKPVTGKYPIAPLR